MHALHATLLFIIAKRLFQASETRNGTFIAGAAILLFTICPHISEVIVWKASFHFLMGGIMIAAILYWLQNFLTGGSPRFAWLAFVVFLLSTFSIEVFYLTPWLSLSLVLYYRHVLKVSPAITKKAILWFFLPQLILFFGHLLLLYVVTGAHVAHIGHEIHQPAVAYLRKAPGHIFHLVFLGRYFPQEIRQSVYNFFTGALGLSLFYGLLLALVFVLMIRFKSMKQGSKPAVLFFLWILMHLALLSPLWLPEMQLVSYDRYSYLMLPFMYLVLVFLLSRVNSKIIRYAIFGLYCLVNVYFTLRVNRLWQKSAKVVDSLTMNFPDPGNRTILLLNLPENFNGVPMIGSLPESFFKLRYNIYHKPERNNKFYDVASYNIFAPDNGARVNVINDSTIKVTLNQWGTWWWYQFQGGHGYDNEDFKLDMKDVGHWYELTLHKPADSFLILYSVGDTWKVVDMNRRNEDQN
jgi:hypothetical protein